MERRKRLNAKEAAALDAAMDVDAVAPALKKTKKTGKKMMKKTVAASDAPAPMQD